MDINDPIPDEWQRVLDAYLADPKRRKRDAYNTVFNIPNKAHASQRANRLFKDPRVLRAIQERDRRTRDAAHLTVVQVGLHLAELVCADPRDLIEYRRGACRYCYGEGHRYHRTPAEYERALAAYRVTPDGSVAKDPLGLGFNTAGGIGYTPKRDPHPDCPECYGDGEGYTFAKDMRNVSKGAAQLYASIKETKDGFEIKTRSKDKALELAMRQLGMLRDKEPGEDSEVPPAGTVTFQIADAS